jgi:hypothetical protein
VSLLSHQILQKYFGKNLSIIENNRFLVTQKSQSVRFKMLHHLCFGCVAYKVNFYFHDVKTLVTQGDSISKIEYLLLFVALTPLRGLEGKL